MNAATDLFIERFPRYALELPFWEEVPLAEKDLSLPPLAHAEIIYAAGLHPDLFFRLEGWLREDANRRLIFLEPEGGRVRTFLADARALPILSSGQCELYRLPLGREGSSLLEELAARYPKRGVYVAHAGESRLKQRILRKSAYAHAQFVDRFRIPTLLSHLLQNAHRLPGAFYANGLKNRFQGIPAFICGAGPSLEQSFGLLRTLEKRALVIAGGSAIGALHAQGIRPHFAMAMDPNAAEGERFAHLRIDDVPLLFSTRLLPRCFSSFGGPLGYLRSGMGGLLELWLEEELGLVEPPLGAGLPPEAASVTLLAVQFALHAGCDPILLDGVDLAYTENRRYATGVSAAEEEGASSAFDRTTRKKGKTGRLVRSAVRWSMEADALSLLARRHRGLISCTAGGLPIRGMEAMPLAQAVDLFCREERDLRALVRAAIADAPLPVSKEDVARSLDKLQNSAREVLRFLDILAEEPASSQAILAEFDLEDEPVYRLLGGSGWERPALRELARRFLEAFDTRGVCS